MRLSPLLLLLALAGCVGQVRDFVGPRSSIVSPQLIRYGFDLAQTRCVGERLGASLRPKQLRLFARAAGSVRQGFYDPTRLGIRDLLWVATTMRDPAVRAALDRANSSCGVPVTIRVLDPTALPRALTAPSTSRQPTWLNLGAAGSGQSIAIDAASIEETGAERSAWFRMTEPGARTPSPDAYLLRIDCARRTINSKTRRRRDAAGALVEQVDYPDNPLPVEGGTVMEIAFLSLCT